MEDLEYFQNAETLFDKLISENCLCSHNALKAWQSLFYHSFEVLNEDKLDCQILCLSIARHTGDIFISQATNYHAVCSEIFDLLKYLASDDLWNVYVKHFQNVKDLHLQWVFMKAMCSILFSSSDVIFKTRACELLQMMKGNLLNEMNVSILQLVSSLVSYTSNSCSNSTKCSCHKSTACSVTPYKDLLLHLYDEMYPKWDNFLIEFHAEISCPVLCRKKSITEFLILWSSLSNKNLPQKCISKFYNREAILEFFKSLRNLPSHSLRIYADVILHILNLDLQNRTKYLWDVTDMEKIITFAIVKDLLLMQSTICETSNFTSMKCSKRLPSEIAAEDIKWDIILTRKILCIYFRVLSELNNESTTSEVLPKLVSCIKANFILNASKSSVIIHYFIEDDELLFDVMLSTLRIYAVIKDSRIQVPEMLSSLKKDINPHYLFVKLLQELGYDHNELISFLTSDETCFLLYLVQYLKLLTNEWQDFLEVHLFLLKDEAIKRESDENSKFALNTESDLIVESVGFLDNPQKSKSIPQLVPYVDSSDDENDSSNEFEPGKLDKRVEKSMLVLVHLKFALERLTKIDEFPYKTSPLIHLLQECEKKWLTKNELK